MAISCCPKTREPPMTAATAGPDAIGARRVMAIALPVMLSNATVPIQGAVDTAIIGNLGSDVYLAAVGLGAQIFSLLFGVFNFLQIGTSGLTAQALGAGDAGRVLNTLARALIVALALAAALLLGQGALRAGGLALFAASAEAERLAAVYFDIRILAAPAELSNYALLGWFTGQEMTRRLFQHQLVLSLSNIAFNLLFVLGFGMEVEGVALGTVLASWLGLAYGLWLASGRVRAIRPPGWRLAWARVLQRAELWKLMALNRDIFIRTLLLIGAFAWMTRMGSTLGDATLAANVVLWQFFEVSAYALDGFAMAAETLVGQALGARSAARLRRAAVETSLWSGLIALGFSAALVAISGPVVDLFTNVPEVRALAREYALWAALTPALGFAAFQLDGIFVGATASREMRNAMILAATLYFPAAWAMTEALGNHGVWAGIHLFLLARAATLLRLYPRIEARAAAL
jgi:MATE family multidrug resistance protein